MLDVLTKLLDTRKSCRKFSEKSLPESAIRCLAKSVYAVPSAGHKHPLRLLCFTNPLQISALAHAAGGKQSWIADAPCVIVVAAESNRMESMNRRYGKSAIPFMHVEVGCAVQNIYLLCAAMGLGTVAVGAFKRSAVRILIGEGFEPVILMPVGYPRKETK